MDTAKQAIERNAELITITLFVFADLLITNFAIDYSIVTLSATTSGPNSLIYLLDVKRLFIDTQLLNTLLLFKSLILYMIGIEVGKRLHTTNRASDPPHRAGGRGP